MVWELTASGTNAFVLYADCEVVEVKDGVVGVLWVLLSASLLICEVGSK